LRNAGNGNVQEILAIQKLAAIGNDSRVTVAQDFKRTDNVDGGEFVRIVGDVLARGLSRACSFG
jgi:hypothetical protein